MGWGLFWRKLFGGDARIDFYAKIFASLIIATDRLSYEELDLIKKVAGLLFTQKDDETFFIARVFYHLELCVKNELHINQIIRRIDYLNRQHPTWIKGITKEAVAACRMENDGLQDRVVEFVESMQNPRRLASQEAEALKGGSLHPARMQRG